MSQRVRSNGIVGVIMLLALFTLAPIAWAAPSAQPADSLEAKDQPLRSGSITVETVMASQDGWVTVHLDEGGKPGKVLGHGPVKKGANSGVVVKLDEAVQVGTKVWPMLHIDASQIGTYEFPGPDAPVIVNGNIVMKQITITAAPAGLPTAGQASGAAPLLLAGFALFLLSLGVWVRHRKAR